MFSGTDMATEEIFMVYVSKINGKDPSSGGVGSTVIHHI
jgi:hypothetical protein